MNVALKIERWAVDPAIKGLTIPELAMKLCDSEAFKYDGPTPCMEHTLIAEQLLIAMNT